jgi:hypothetical protein
MTAKDFLKTRGFTDLAINGYSLADMLDEYLKLNILESNPGFKVELLSAIGKMKDALEEKIDQRFKSLKITYE